MQAMPKFIATWRDERLAAIPDPPDILYHYTDTPGLMGIFSSSQLWATDAMYTNDRTEVLHSLVMLRLVLDELGLDRMADLAVDTMLIAAEEFYTVVQVLAVSFCKDGDLLSQWRGYGQAGGYSIGFDSKVLKSLTTKDVMITPVVYNPETQEQQIHTLVGRWRELFVDTDPKEFNKQNRRLSAFIFAQALIFLAATFKSHGFHEEAEWRLAYRRQVLAKDDTALTLGFRDRKGMVASFAHIPLPEVKDGRGPARRIVLGPTANPNLVGFGLYQYLQSLGYSADAVEIAPSEVTLRL